MKNLALALILLAAGVAGAAGEVKIVEGPGIGDIGGMAQIKVPKGWKFVPEEGCAALMEASHNLASGNEKGILLDTRGQDGMWVVFLWDEIGYVKDAEKEKLDAGKLWDSLKEGNKEGNEERRKRGWPEMELVKWQKEPSYNPKTQRLEWALRLKSGGEDFINFHTRVLGRKGVMKVIISMSAKNVDRQIADFNGIIGGFDFTKGNKYAEWTTGEKVAAAGLSALVLGGAGALAAKTGLLAKFWKLIVVGLAAVGGFFKKAWDWVRGRKKDDGHGNDQLNGGNGSGPIVP